VWWTSWQFVLAVIMIMQSRSRARVARLVTWALVVVVLACALSPVAVQAKPAVTNRIVGNNNPSLRGLLSFLQENDDDDEGDGEDKPDTPPPTADAAGSGSGSGSEDESEALEKIVQSAVKGDNQEEDEDNNSEQTKEAPTPEVAPPKTTRLAGEVPDLAKNLTSGNVVASMKGLAQKLAPAPVVPLPKKKKSPWAEYIGSLEPTGIGSKCSTTCRKSKKRKAQVCETICQPLTDVKEL
jgi:hypothetical protein